MVDPFPPAIGMAGYPYHAPLRDRAVFDRFDLDGWTVCWLGGSIDIAPEHLYEMGHAA